LFICYSAGVLVFAIAITFWIAAEYADFVAQTAWWRAADLGSSPWDFLQRRAQQVIDLFGTPQAQAVWLVDAVGVAILLLSRPSPARRKIVTVLILVHALLFAFPRQNRFYTVAFVYFWGLALSLALTPGGAQLRCRGDGRFPAPALRRSRRHRAGGARLLDSP
jgi:uncharacterized membrane protein YczE